MRQVTCGVHSPLTATGYKELGQLQWVQKRRLEARASFKRAYEIEGVHKDAFDLNAVLPSCDPLNRATCATRTIHAKIAI